MNVKDFFYRFQHFPGYGFSQLGKKCVACGKMMRRAVGIRNNNPALQECTNFIAGVGVFKLSG